MCQIMTNQNVLGIDASLTGTGIAVFDLYGNKSGIDLVHNEAIQVKSTGEERLKAIRDRIADIISSWQIGYVAIEGYAFSRANQAHQIGELGGVLRLFLHEHNIPFVEIAPSAVKKFATGKGNAQKHEVAAHVQKRWDVMFKTNDETDAYVIGRMGTVLAGGGAIDDQLTMFQQEVIDELRGVRSSGKAKGKTRKVSSSGGKGKTRKTKDAG